jgi:hypothetical protein
MLATPVASELSVPGEAVGVGDTTSDGVALRAGGETLGPRATPVAVHAVANMPRMQRIAPIARARGRTLDMLSPSLPHAPRRIRTYDAAMVDAETARPTGFVPAVAAAGVAFATTVVYVILVVSQGDDEVLPVAFVAGYIAALGACALAGALRTRPDRVILLGTATGGLIGAAIVSLFSIGLLLLAAGALALAAWMRAGVGASPRQQLLGGIAGIGASLVFLVVLLLV